MKSIILISDWAENVRTVKGENKVVASFNGLSHGQKYPQKYSCWEESGLFDKLKEAWRNKTNIGVEYEVKESGNNPHTNKPYKNNIVSAVGEQGQAGQNTPSTPSYNKPTPPPTHNEPDWEAINKEKCKEIDISGAMSNATHLVAHSCINLPTAEQLNQIEDIATKLIVIKKKLRKEYDNGK